MIELDEDLEMTVTKQLVRAGTKALKRCQSFSNSDWQKLVNEAIIELKRIPNVLSVYINIDEIYGLQLDVICKENTYVDTMGAIVELDMSSFDKYPNLWGSFRTHDVRGEMHSHYQNNYKVSLVKIEKKGE